MNPIFWIILILAVLYIWNTNWGRGVIGELQVRILLRMMLPSGDYFVLHNVILPSGQGSTEIDHLIFSRYGIFVIETKNRGGWIYGNQYDKQWTQTFSRYAKFKFQNPLRQNYKHTMTVVEKLKVPKEHVHSIVAFNWRATFKTDMPHNVLKFHRLPSYVKSHYEQVFSEEANTNYLNRIEQLRQKGFLAKLGHIWSLRR